jgi:hypothetical protein
VSQSRLRPCTWLLGSVLILAGPAARAGQIWTVSLDTSRLATNYTGPFALDFELVGSNGNTVTLGHFSFGSGGSAGPGPAFVTGGASGNLGSGVSLNDSVNFFSDFNQQLMPGQTLTFTMDSTVVPPPLGGSPDNFSMAIFSGYDTINGYNPFKGSGGTAIPTTDPTGSDTFFNFNVNGPGATTVESFPSANGEISIVVTPTSVVAEPSSGVMALLSVLRTAGAICWRCKAAGRRRARRELEPSASSGT